MKMLFLAFLLQLLSGVSMPLHTVRYGRMSVPFVLQYQTEADSSGYVVAPYWTLKVGEMPLANPGCDTVSGDGTHFRFGPSGELTQLVDDAGNRIALSPMGVSWPRGAVAYAFSDGQITGFTVFDADSIAVCKVSFEVESSLNAVRVIGRDSTEVCEFRMDYEPSGTLRSITRTDGGSVEFSFVSDAFRNLKRSVCRKDSKGNITGVSEYVYSRDSLYHYLTETVTDGRATTRKTVRGFRENEIIKKEEYTRDNRLTRSTFYQYTDGDIPRLESVKTVSYPEDSLAPPCTSVRSYKYVQGKPFPYPVEVETLDSCGVSERFAYSYPFCPPMNYGPVADSLLARGMVGVMLSMSRWKEGMFVDSTTVVYEGFSIPEAPTERYFRPASIVYADGMSEPEACIQYTAYDGSGLRSSRARVGQKAFADKLPPEVFRWTAPDPLDDLLREQQSHDLCAAWPEVVPDEQSGNSFLFDGSGTYLGKVAAGEHEVSVVVDRGFGSDPLSARFSDSEKTPLQIDGHTALEVVSTEALKADLDKAGAFEANHHGLIKGMWFLWCESQFGQKLDFAENSMYDIYPGKLYVTKAGEMGAIVHDNYNFGNFLWGAAAYEVGVPRWIALLGSHVHAFFSPYSWGNFDSPDDIFSIRSGYHWAE